MRRMKKVAAATLTAIMVASIAMGTTESWARSSTRAAWNNAAAQSKDEEQIVNDACYAEDGSVTEERNVKVLSNLMVDLTAHVDCNPEELGVTELVYYQVIKEMR